MTATTLKFLLLGSDGQVGRELQRTLGILGEVIPTTLSGGEGLRLDLLDTEAVTATVKQQRPDFIINAAAHTAVDKAETEVDLSRRLNADVPELLGQLASELGARVIHYSTDFVFPGDSDRPYREEDRPAPISVYGKTKLEGEQRLLASGADALVLRTSWVYGNYGHNFMLTMMRLFREKGQLSVVDDQIGAPTWSRMVAEATAQIVHKLPTLTPDTPSPYGIYHLTAAGETSWYGFASSILELMGESCTIQPVPTRDYPTPAKRPAYSVLDNSKLKQRFGLQLPDWRVSLQQCIADRAS
ncbi:MAG: dTDP-4-dehydrorhamnose reductase [gamma proteobacterium symbiont of Ctena orbiculata]|uniref:dTDP-4-dehydrorhamnose reductase n=1 Tax=Candidatus Thiodiazotropha taylori TaxID=2792791 RepID=A0A944MF09_9GAMM|nr:dTDP-4-dehydrorhamnose reductase [Candidatus Thiodiazotropha taylori]PUB87400.1 MAG: dTDP-4-dehydrorhamnose reductase [gamma proteobacterium symbiont of Ctena orbiculata]MBT2990653.1 dTDP-4-dehydrorhamnose reductase [Candidatus Thiodiazotropha taylori]MBT2996863.1 dTDP-4-dehydrorhamnose reductase [Candidatus Thiodiazotropha taylori]MBT3002096.1 dTDP-4-dehydrorhamnose reductase [Candidatus Thiodiazotropha taylori]